MTRRSGPRLRAFDALSRQAQAILDYYPNADAAARAVGINSSTLYTARRGINAINTSSAQKIEEAYQVVQSIRRAEAEQTLRNLEAHAGLGRMAQPFEAHLTEAHPEPPRPSLTEVIRQQLRTPVTPISTPEPEDGVSQIDVRTCDVCERTKPLTEGFYWKAEEGNAGIYEKHCKMCSSRLRDRVQRVLKVREREWQQERAVLVAQHTNLTEEYRMLADDYAQRLAQAQAAAASSSPINPGEVAMIEIAVGQLVEHFLDLATEVERVQRLVAGLGTHA